MRDALASFDVIGFSRRNVEEWFPRVSWGMTPFDFLGCNATKK